MIARSVASLLAELPAGVELVAAAKARTPHEVLEAVDAGVRIVGENYVQEAERAFGVVGGRVRWHFIGHLQRNKVTRAVRIFDMVESVGSLALAEAIDRRCAQIGKLMPVLIEVNSGRERQKSGVFPEDVESLVRQLSALENVNVMGLMTIGPLVAEAEDIRPHFRATKQVFERLGALALRRVEMRYLSMGMTATYRVAIEEGANLVRIGSGIFGPRN